MKPYLGIVLPNFMSAAIGEDLSYGENAFRGSGWK